MDWWRGQEFVLAVMHNCKLAACSEGDVPPSFCTNPSLLYLFANYTAMLGSQDEKCPSLKLICFVMPMLGGSALAPPFQLGASRELGSPLVPIEFTLL